MDPGTAPAGRDSAITRPLASTASVPMAAARSLPRRLAAAGAALVLVAALVALVLEWTSPSGAGMVVGGASLGLLAPAGGALRGRVRGFRTPALSPVLALPAGVVAREAGGRELVKRALDVVIAALALALLTPLFLVLTLAVAIADGGPVLYAQWRVGRGGETFRMLKFRTMRVGADREPQALPGWKCPDDERVTAVGRLLRRTSLDELPQLLHVLSGRMSIVGPRPLPIYEAPAVPAWATARWAVKPGLTCSWQVSGRSDLTWEERMRLDGDYVDGWSVRSDLGLMLRTVRAVASGRGAY